MSIFSAAVASLRGGWDRFDSVQALISSEIEAIEKADPTEFPTVIQLGVFMGEAHIVSTRDEMLTALRNASTLVDDVCQLCQECMAATPD
jgi:hypothetical protein